MRNHSLKKLFAVFLSFFLFFSSAFTARAEGGSIELPDDNIFVKTGETVTVPFTVTGAGEVTIGEVYTYSSTADELAVNLSVSGSSIVIKSESGTGVAYVEILLDGDYSQEMEVYIYDDQYGCEMYDMEDRIYPLNFERISIGAMVEPGEAMYIPVSVTSSAPSVAEPEHSVMAANQLWFTLKKTGTTKITVSYGSQSKSFILTVLPEGDYAQYVEVEDNQSTYYLKTGNSLKIPAKMVSDQGTCKDDELTFKIDEEYDSPGTIVIAADGTITAKKSGTVIVGIYTKLGRQFSAVLHVYDEPESISFSDDIYYLNQNNEWIWEPYPLRKPDGSYYAPLVYTSSDPGIIKVTQVEDDVVKYEFVKEGEVTIRAAYKNNPKIYGEFKAKAINADYPEKISTVSSVILYPDFQHPIDVEFTPYASLHEFTVLKMADPSIATIEGNSAEKVFLIGNKPGKTTLTLQAGPKASAKVNVEVKDGMPASKTFYNAAPAEKNVYPNNIPELTDSFRFAKGNVYCLEFGKEFEGRQYYLGMEDLLGADSAKNLENTKLFEVLEVSDGPGYRIIWVKALKSGTASVELIKGEKKNLTVVDSNKVEMYRLYNPNSGEHFYTAKAGEKDALVTFGWQYEGIGWNAPASSASPVYRLYNANAGDHHYTMKIGERDALVKVGWDYEGIGWYSDDNKTVPLYRQYNPNAVSGSHNYTTNKKENDALVKIGWIEEGIGWYGIK